MKIPTKNMTWGQSKNTQQQATTTGRTDCIFTLTPNIESYYREQFCRHIPRLMLSG